jgi:hypothetical protein
MPAPQTTPCGPESTIVDSESTPWINYCSKLVNFGLVCYAPISNWKNMLATHICQQWGVIKLVYLANLSLSRQPSIHPSIHSSIHHLIHPTIHPTLLYISSERDIWDTNLFFHETNICLKFTGPDTDQGVVVRKLKLSEVNQWNKTEVIPVHTPVGEDGKQRAKYISDII